MLAEPRCDDGRGGAVGFGAFWLLFVLEYALEELAAAGGAVAIRRRARYGGGLSGRDEQPGSAAVHSHGVNDPRRQRRLAEQLQPIRQEAEPFDGFVQMCGALELQLLDGSLK